MDGWMDGWMEAFGLFFFQQKNHRFQGNFPFAAGSILYGKPWRNGEKGKKLKTKK